MLEGRDRLYRLLNENSSFLEGKDRLYRLLKEHSRFLSNTHGYLQTGFFGARNPNKYFLYSDDVCKTNKPTSVQTTTWVHSREGLSLSGEGFSHSGEGLSQGDQNHLKVF